MPSPALRRRGVRRPARPTPRQQPEASPAGGTAPTGSSESTCPSRPRSRRARQGGSGAGRRGRAAAGRKWARSRRTVRCGAAGAVRLLPAGRGAVPAVRAWWGEVLGAGLASAGIAVAGAVPTRGAGQLGAPLGAVQAGVGAVERTPAAPTPALVLLAAAAGIQGTTCEPGPHVAVEGLRCHILRAWDAQRHPHGETLLHRRPVGGFDDRGRQLVGRLAGQHEHVVLGWDVLPALGARYGCRPCTVSRRAAIRHGLWAAGLPTVTGPARVMSDGAGSRNGHWWPAHDSRTQA